MKSLFVYVSLAILILISCGDDNSHPRGSGLIEATEVTVSVEIGGQIKAIYCDEGQNVVAGDTLALIDTSAVALRLRQALAAGRAARTQLELTAINIRQAENNLELANNEFERAATLIKTGSVNQQQYDQAKNAFEQAKLAGEQARAAQRAADAELANANAQINLLENQFEDCFPVSPITGVIVEKFVESGELVTTGKPLVRIASLDTVWVKIYLPPSDLTRISLGGRAFIDPEDGRTQPLPGIITWISSEAEFTPKNVQTREARAGLLYAVKISIPNPGRILKIGMPVSVAIK
jgi:HlyD family secretion protein